MAAKCRRSSTPSPAAVPSRLRLVASGARQSPMTTTRWPISSCERPASSRRSTASPASGRLSSRNSARRSSGKSRFPTFSSTTSSGGRTGSWSGREKRSNTCIRRAMTAPPSNPSCQGQIPLLRSLVLCSKGTKAALTMNVDKARKEVSFGVAKGKAIKQTAGTKRQRGPAICPYCDQPTSTEGLRQAGCEGRMGHRMVAVVTMNKGGKDYRPVEEVDLRALEELEQLEVEKPAEPIAPEISADVIWVHLYGITDWGSLFNKRQLLALQTFVRALHEALEVMAHEVPDEEYRRALALYLALWLDRVAVFANTSCRWEAGRQIVKTPFSGQVIPLMWDYPEVNPLADSSGSASTQLRYMLNVIEHERLANGSTLKEPQILLGNAASLPLESGTAACVVTDPPYDDAISYGDLSDFFYVWLKRSIGSQFPEVFSTPLTPKADEATSLRHRHEGSQERARAHYRRLLKESFSEVLRLAREPKLVTVMFAHQSTDAWTALLSALF